MADSARIVAIVQARMASTRLPGKAMIPIAGKRMLDRVLDRVACSHLLNEVVVATSTQPADDAIADHCRRRGCGVFRGSEEDVLARYTQAASAFSADVVVRVTSDCPLIDAEVLDEVISAYLAARPSVDYASNTLAPRTYPRGLDVEVFSAGALERAFAEDTDPRSREHVTTYLYRRPTKFRLLRIANERDLSAHRWTVDTPEDLAFATAVYEALQKDEFPYADVIALLERAPHIARLNSAVVQKELPA